MKFTAPQIKMDCVGPDGSVNVNRIVLDNGQPFRYKLEHNIADVLMAIRSNMHLPKVHQASQGLAETSY